MFKLKEDMEACENLNFLAFCRYVALQSKYFDNIKAAKIKC